MRLDVLFPLTPVLDRVRRVSTVAVGLEEPTSPVTIVPLEEENLPAAARVLAAAFATEAFTVATFDRCTGRIEDALERVVEIRLHAHLEASQPVFVATVNDRVVGVAVVDRPGFTTSRLRILRLLASHPVTVSRLCRRLDWRGSYHVGQTVSPPDVLPPASYTLEAIGVDPDAQGEGVGRALLEAVHELVECDVGASGCYLVTADESNRVLYERFGYETVATKRANDLRAYHLFRPNRNA
ncbi:GNAT family N-acetyltransferase [Natronobeatus ordinarius]|uniref:GNAT family N-acetyltransferase n=1 Tax=Natronobeatus ordinarius TaxID=2963433 RepID=UPI0020CC81AB|nr:GNAT family N-acetyltransferase [Natronobeatus ordinarius]